MSSVILSLSQEMKIMLEQNINNSNIVLKFKIEIGLIFKIEIILKKEAMSLIYYIKRNKIPFYCSAAKYIIKYLVLFY